MTNVFWLLAASMSVLALLFTIVPLVRDRRVAAVSRQVLNTEVIKEQLNELKADLDAGKLDTAAYRAARHDLERELLNDVEAGAEGDGIGPSERSGRWAIVPLGLLVPATAVLLYLQLGSAPLLNQPPRPAVPERAAQESETGHSLQEMVVQLAERLEQEPDNAEGWVLLGRSYASLNRYQEAVNAYTQARRIAGDHPQLLVDSADILVMASGGRFTADAGKLLERALQVQPDNAKGLWLMGHYQYQSDDLQGAVDHWQRAAALLPVDSEDGRAIRQQIEQARSQLVAAGESPPPATSGVDSTAADGGKAIEVTVSLDSALSAQASPQDTVFIFARAVQGPRMPLAIVRKQVAELPVTVTLDDSLAMTPAMVMSNFEEVTIGARVSKSGNAMPQAGDLEGSVSPVRVATDASVEVVINQLTP